MPIEPQEDSRISEACSQLWQVYLREAEEYDQGLVKSWKEDMDVTLVFSGLYSAVLTAFIVESYRNLQPDQSEASTMLLLHISEQLASLSTTSRIAAATITPFQANPSDIACNVLWFISLILALSCALLATFVQQWTRHFLHRTSILRAPTARARLIGFLYFGLKDFKMHAIVDLIPSLLHFSLFAFFGGLVAFLHPINPALQWIVIVSLIIIVCTYSFFTIMPVISLSSPYQTPLSPIMWRSWQSFWWTLEKMFGSRHLLGRFFRGTTTEKALPTSSRPRQYNLTYAMVAASNQKGQEREYKSMTWTLKSLNGSAQLLPFLEALPEVIYGRGGTIQFDNLHLIKPILETMDPEVDIIARLFCLIQHIQNYRLRDNHRQRCVRAIPKPLWALAYVLNRYPAKFDLTKTGRSSWFTWDQLHILESRDDIPKTWALSIAALMKSNILMCREMELNTTKSQSPPPYHSSDLSDSKEQAKVLRNFLNDAAHYLPDYVGMASSTFHALKGHGYAQTLDTTGIYEALIQRLSILVSQEQNAVGFKTSRELSDWDMICYGLVQICNKDVVPVLSRCLIERMKYPVNASSPGPWVSSCQRDDNHIPGYVPFLRAVMVNGEYPDDCITALQDILLCFDEPFERAMAVPQLDPRWWARVEPTWLDVLSQVETKLSRDTHRSSSLTSLAVMVKGMVLKKTYSTHPRKEKVDFDLAGFISNHINNTIPIEPWPTIQTVRAAYLILILQQLECTDPSDPRSFTSTKSTFRFLRSRELRGVAYEVDSKLAQRLASQTRRFCELWRSHPPFNLMAILECIWGLWEEVDESHGAYVRETFIPEVVLSDIKQAADTIIASEHDAAGWSRTAKTPNDTPFSKRVRKLVERVNAIKGIWDVSRCNREGFT